MDAAAVMALQHHLTALLALPIAAEWIEGRSLGRRGEREEVMQPGTAPDDLLGAAVEPFGQCLIDKQKAAADIDRVKSDRGIVQKIEQLVALVADHRLHLVTCGNVLDIPEAVTGPPGDRIDGDVEPAGSGAASVTQRQSCDGTDPGSGAATQPLEIGRRFRI